MAADGKWQLTINTPLGAQQSTLTVSTSGNALSGTQSAATGDERPIEDGKLNGDQISWKASISKPMPMTLECEAEITGESLTGTMQLGAFGAAPFTGTRRA